MGYLTNPTEEEGGNQQPNNGLLPVDLIREAIKRQELLPDTDFVRYAIAMLNIELELHEVAPGSDAYKELKARQALAGQIVDETAINLPKDPNDEVVIARIDGLENLYRESEGRTLEDILDEFGKTNQLS